jgi:hypothetical protein
MNHCVQMADYVCCRTCASTRGQPHKELLDDFDRSPSLNYCSPFLPHAKRQARRQRERIGIQLPGPEPAVVVMTSSGLLNRYAALTPMPTCLKRSYQARPNQAH